MFPEELLPTTNEALQTQIENLDAQVQPAPSAEHHHHVHFADFSASYGADAVYGDALDYTAAPVGTDQQVVPTHIADDISPQGDSNGTELRDFLQEVMGLDAMALPSSGLKSGTWTPRDIFDFGVDTNLELNDVDLGFLDVYNQHNPFGLTPPASTSAVQSVASDAPSDPPLGIDTFQKSSAWKFRPVARDSSSNYLSLPPTDMNKRFPVDKRITLEPLSYTTRDQIIAMIAKVGPDSRSFLSFPSLELLDSLLQYFISTTAAPTYLVHIPTFFPCQKNYELSAAMIAAGAALTPDASLRKLGYVVQETLRLHIPGVVSKNFGTHHRWYNANLYSSNGTTPS